MPTNNDEEIQYLYDEGLAVDPLGDADRLDQQQKRKNFAKVGSARPSSLMYTYGPGSVMDLPHFTVMPMGLDEWERIYARRQGEATIHAPRLLNAVRLMLGPQVKSLRPFPWQAKESTFSHDGADLGIPARVFPQWMRCTGCDKLAPVSEFTYVNTRPGRPDMAEFVHENCSRNRTGKEPNGKTGKKPNKSSCVPARYLLACPDGHLDEFPYDWFVHRGGKCPQAENPDLRMHENATGRGSGTTIECLSCGAKRGMSEAQGAVGRKALPACRGRHPHLDCFDNNGKGCECEPRLMLVGASNLWFPATQSIVDMPLIDDGEREREMLDRLKDALGPTADFMLGTMPSSVIKKAVVSNSNTPSMILELTEEEIDVLIALHKAPPESEEEQEKRREDWEPTDLLVPEWRYLQNEPPCEHSRHEASGLTLSPREVAPELLDLGVSRILAVDSLRKVNALLGFTRIDDLDRVNNRDRLVRLTRNGKPEWVPATEDRGEGVFLQLDEGRVAAWEQRVMQSVLWRKHREAFLRNYENRLSETARHMPFPLERMPKPRYWLVHALAHALIRRMAASAGYGIPSLSERIYAWDSNEEKKRSSAAGLLIMTTASDSDGTLGGLVALSKPERLSEMMLGALRDALRCSSDPVCAQRVPEDPEDFLHGAACHCCTMISETSCERANRFLDRRLLVPLPGSYEGERFADLAFFDIDGSRAAARDVCDESWGDMDGAHGSDGTCRSVAQGLYEGTDTGIGMSVSSQADDPWAHYLDPRFIDEYCLDDQTVSFMRSMAEARVPVPDDFGYEIADGRQAEIAWVGRRACYLTIDQAGDRTVFESQGWTVAVGGEDAEMMVAALREC